ncbi:MAG: hypothetical protein IJR88_02375 [Clostridia bacterium]|nr:hypothetical protein [Clostridia bacterium]
MKFTISLAGVKIGVTSLYEEVYTLCRDYLVSGEPDFSVTIDASDIEFEREKSASEAKHEGRIPEYFSDGYLETLAVYRKIVVKMLDYNAFLMHGAVVGLNGKAYLFTAPSGVGKTTHTSFWLKKYPNAFILNGDKPILRFMDGKVFACGTPWAGKEGRNKNAILPLAAICVLFRGKENKIEKIDFAKVFHLIIAQTYRPEERSALETTLQFVGKLGETVPFYALACNLDPNAACVAKEGMVADE